MGSPLGPIFANIFLSYHESTWLDICSDNYKPVFYRRYVDDTFSLFKNAECAENFAAYLNTRHSNMRFTIENENGESLPFIGINIMKNCGRFDTSVYRKPTFSCLYTNFDSFLPNRYKLSLVNTLMHRAYEICSNFNLMHEEFSKIKNILLKNGFTSKLFDATLKSFLNKKYVAQTKPTHVEKRKIAVILPFYGSMSIFMRNYMRRFLSKIYPQINFSFVFLTVEKIGSHFRVKDRFPIALTSNVVYQYNCHCCDAIYIGKTSRLFGIRHAEHTGISIRTNKPVRPDSNSAIHHHSNRTGHVVNSDHFKIIDRAENAYFTQIKEAPQIAHNKPSLNQLEQPYLVLMQN